MRTSIENVEVTGTTEVLTVELDLYDRLAVTRTLEEIKEAMCYADYQPSRPTVTVYLSFLEKLEAFLCKLAINENQLIQKSDIFSIAENETDEKEKFHLDEVETLDISESGVL